MKPLLICTDCLPGMMTMDAASVDAVVTDPPYGLAFMGKEWDHGVPGVRFWEEALRVAKPGAHLVAFGGTRTFHRLACAMEDAGWEIRDCLSWLYGSGFPKSLNLDTVPGMPAQWHGWGTALKPAWEPILLGRKPLVGTVAANVAAHGTGALNVDGCRIGYASIEDLARTRMQNPGREDKVSSAVYGAGRPQQSVNEAGRWPANVALDEAAAAMLDQQSGDIPTQRIDKPCPEPTIHGHQWGTMQGNRGPRGYSDTGGASRFFYVAKASRSERNAGLEGMERKTPHPPGGDGRAWDIAGSNSKPRENYHPTVKPMALMRWLCRLVTPPGGLILDPFMGSGTTGCAAVFEGFGFVGFEQDPEYAELARRRVEHWSRQDRQLDLEVSA